MKKLLWVAVCLAGCVSQTDPRSGTNTPPPTPAQKSATDAKARAKVHTDLGMAYLQSGQIAVAMDEARIATDTDPDYAPAYNLLGLAHMYLADNAKAQANFERALRLTPNDSDINNNYGSFLCQTGRAQEAMAYFQAALRNPLYETPTIAYTNAGRCALQVKDEAAAEDYLRKAIVLDPRNQVAILELAHVFYARNKLQEAQRLVTELHRLSDPTAATLWLALRIEHKLGNRETEIQYASQLRRKFPGTPEHQALQQGKYE